MGKILFFILFLLSNYSFCQNFEGQIDFVKYSLFDTIYYSYKIKTDYIRIDERDKYKKPIKTFIINLQDTSVFVINYEKKIYKRVIINEYNSVNNIKIINTGIYKYICGYKCHQYRVRDERNNIEITYWMTNNNINLFNMLNFYNKIIPELNYMIFLNVKGFPLLIESKTLLRNMKSTICAISVNEKKINDSYFVIPSTYILYND